MSDEVWMKHSNPWSVWTRFATLPFLALAIWSRVWIENYAWGIVGLLVLWLIINPRAFKKPKTTKNWASKAVFGEKIWLNNTAIPVPKHHNFMAKLLGIITGFGIPFVVWGLYNFDFFATLLGVVVIYLGKMWFLDRMVWIFEDMKDNDEYKHLLY